MTKVFLFFSACSTSGDVATQNSNLEIHI